MQAFISGEQKPKQRKNRAEIDPRETAAFLNRPVRKPVDLNQSLRKSYEKNFFKGPRFQHFKTLRDLRKGIKETDSIASFEGEDEDYEVVERKNKDALSPRDKVVKKEMKASKQQRKQRKGQKRGSSSSSFSSSQSIPTNKANKKMAKRPPKKEVVASSSSSASDSSGNSKSDSSKPGSSSKQPREGSESSSGTRQEGKDNVLMTVINEKLDSSTKDEAAYKLEVNFPRFQPLLLKVSGIKQSQSELSEEPQQTCQLTSCKVKSPTFISANTPKSPILPNKSRQVQISQVNFANKLKIQFSEGKDAIKQEQRRQSQKESNIKSEICLQTEPIPVVKTPSRSPHLSTHSRVIAQSIYLCSNHSKTLQPMDLKKWEELSAIFLHAPCCPYYHQTNNISKASLVEEEPKSHEGDEDPFETQPVDPSKQTSIVGKDQVKPKKAAFRRKNNSNEQLRKRCQK